MPDPADKSDDLIAELAKLMAAPTGKPNSPPPPAKPAPLNLTPISTAPAAAASPPPPVRIPGMDSAASKPAAAAPTPVADTRAPATGTIRIPGMDQPAPVSTSVPVGKFDFGKPVAAAAIKQEPLSTLSERLAAQNPSPPPAAAPRIPSSLTPVSENRSFAEGPALPVAKPGPATAAAPASDFSFDFGFTQNPPAASSAPPAAPQAAPATAVANSADAQDPIAALIEADMVDQAPAAEPETAADEPPTRPASPAAPVLRAVNGQSASPRPTIAPAGSAAARPVNNAPIALKPVSVTPRPPESDRFAISPGVGLNMKPPASQPLGAPVSRSPQPPPVHDDDPMSEIESLIGEAVRVELTPGPVRVQAPQLVSPRVELEAEEEVEAEIAHHREPAPAPVVPPLTTQFAPRRANLKDDATGRSAEDAILAAAAASGSDVGRMDPSVGGESPYRRLKVKPERSSFFSGGLRQYIGMAVAGTLLLAAGLGLYWVLNMGRSSGAGANAPVLTADATPAKVLPSAAPTAPTDVAKSPVLAKMDGATSSPSSEQLVSTEQSTADVTKGAAPAAAGGDNESGLANRKVRTVTVRPDGTIVSGDDAVAGGEALPVDRPNVPAVPSTETTNLLGNTEQAASPTPLVPSALDATQGSDTSAPGSSTQTADASPVIDTTQVAPTPMQFPVRGATAPKQAASAPTNTAVNALMPSTTKPQQLDLMGNSGGDGTTAQKPLQVAAAKSVPATPAPTAPASSGGTAAAYVQLSSQPSAADAQASMKSMTAKYGSLFGGNQLTVQQVDLGQKGMRWRVRLPADSLSTAASICAQIKAQGGDCFATSG